MTSLADIAEAEAAQVAAGAEPCGKTCDDGCHTPVVCVRVSHAHDPDADMGINAAGHPNPPGDVSPHLGYDADGQLVQWNCLPGDHDELTDAERAAVVAEKMATATRLFLASIDPALLIQLLREGGHLP